MTPLFKQNDNADGQLLASINASSLTLVLKSGEGANFPQPIKDSCTSGGSSILLNCTGAGALGLSVGDYIYNITDDSFAFIISVDTNSVETTPLYGGTDNTWQSADEFVTRQFVATLNKRDSNGNITDSEQVLIHERSTDTLTIPTGGRGYNGTTPAPFDADDYVSILVDELMPDGVEGVLSGLDQKKFENDFSQGIANDTTLKAWDNAGTSLIDLLKVTTSDILEFQTHPRTFSGRTIADNQDLIDLEYFLANLPTGGTINFTLGENLTAEDLVRIYNDGGTAKIKELLADAIGSAQQVSTHSSYNNIDVCAIDTDKIVIVYEYSNAIYAVCCTISGTTLTVGTRATINSSTASNFPTVCKLDTNKFVVGFRYYDGSTQHASTKACTVSGTTITIGSATDAKTGLNGSVRVVQMGTDKFVSVYGGGSSGTWTGTVYGRVATVSGTTISYGTEQTMIASVTDISAINCTARVADEKFYIFSNSDVLYCTISGTVITANARASIATKITGVPFAGINSTNFLIYEPGYIHVYAHDGAGSETFVDTVAIDFTVYQIEGLETDKKFMIQDATNSGFRKAWIDKGTLQYARCYVPSGSNVTTGKRFCQYGSTTIDQFFYAMTNGYGLIGTVNDFEDFAGIIQESGSSGESHPIAVKGAQSSIHTFASADFGKTVCIQEAGGLGTTMTTFPIGKVYSADTMVISNG